MIGIRDNDWSIGIFTMRDYSVSMRAWDMFSSAQFRPKFMRNDSCLWLAVL